MKSRRIIPIFVPHEGCPHDCVFCNQNTITGKIRNTNEEIVDADFVKNTVEEYLDTIDKNKNDIEISFFGGTFTAINMDKQRSLLKVAKEYKARGLIDYIRLSTRPDYIDDFILKHLKDFTVDIIELGIQSLDIEVLESAIRGHTPLDVKEASLLIKEYGFTLGHQIMLGLPKDTMEKDIKTAKESIAMKPDILRIYPALVIKDTPMETMYKKGTYKPYSLYMAVEVSKIIYAMYTISGINVIRIGLQPTEEINYGKELIDGPFHPSFGELVQGSILKDIIIDRFDENLQDKIYINPKMISKLYANKKYYFNIAKDYKKKKDITVIQKENIDINEVVFSGKVRRVININQYLRNKVKEYMN